MKKSAMVLTLSLLVLVFSSCGNNSNSSNNISSTNSNNITTNIVTTNENTTVIDSTNNYASNVTSNSENITINNTTEVNNIIRIEAKNMRTTFSINENFSLGNNIKVIGYYNDNNQVEIEEYKVDSSEVDVSKAGTYKVIISYNELTFEYEVTYSNQIDLPWI